jgi:hypothetical protein
MVGYYNMKMLFELDRRETAKTKKRLYFVVTNAGIRKQFSTHIDIDPKYWDKLTYTVDTKCPNAYQINDIIRHIKYTTERKYLELTFHTNYFNIYEIHEFVETLLNVNPTFDSLKLYDYSIFNDDDNINKKPIVSKNKNKNDFSKLEPIKEKGYTYVYIMQDEINNYYKIGKSKKPSLRERTLQSEKPSIKLIYCKKTDLMQESILHNKYSTKRIRGEWFRLTDNDIYDIKNYLEEL